MTTPKRCGSCEDCRFQTGRCSTYAPKSDALTGNGRLWQKRNGSWTDITDEVAAAVQHAPVPATPDPVPEPTPATDATPENAGQAVPDAPLTHRETGRLIGARIRQLAEQRKARP